MKPGITDAVWQRMLARGYVSSTIKGNPYISHARKELSDTALCGKEPGGSRTKYMKNRTGWYHYVDGRKPSCKACSTAIMIYKRQD